jgi:methanogenic corrinoid protein MtbC1
MSDQLVEAIADMRDADAVALTRQILESNANPMTILDDCRTAMEIVGKRFEQGDYFLPELILAGETLKQIAALVKPRVQQVSGAPRGAKIILGTVQGDIHDIGKDIVGFMLDVNGFQVYDLGVDVPSQIFVEKIALIKPDIVALSGFLTVAFNSMKNTVAAIQAAGLRDQVKIMVGGGAIDDNVRAYVGADAFGESAIAAVALARAWAP